MLVPVRSIDEFHGSTSTEILTEQVDDYLSGNYTRVLPYYVNFIVFGIMVVRISPVYVPCVLLRQLYRIQHHGRAYLTFLCPMCPFTHLTTNTAIQSELFWETDYFHGLIKSHVFRGFYTPVATLLTFRPCPGDGAGVLRLVPPGIRRTLRRRRRSLAALLLRSAPTGLRHL